MTDRELLEKAAKASGIKLCWVEIGEGDPDCAPGWYCTNVTSGGWFSPLTDDGDALRLAVKLRISPYLAETPPDQPEAGVAVPTEHGPRWEYFCGSEGDPYAATRRAIVRAAAAMADYPSKSANSSAEGLK